MTVQEDDPRLVFLLIEKTQTPPSGIINHIKGHYWVYHPSKGLVFYRSRLSDPPAPQCNTSELMVRRFQSQMYPWAEVTFIPSVFYRVNPKDHI